MSRKERGKGIQCDKRAVPSARAELGLSSADSEVVESSGGLEEFRDQRVCLWGFQELVRLVPVASDLFLSS